ncbi:hypothetical protein FA10DRAFT_106573 [Acaromyces ingoldii]|uniref:Dynein light chain n=1 Tax=Acaromyces ingoldii TaxID=215250 RepID=A0A316YLS5_9BASI|nr:hypothetical protein FA10DRAFT_106573 [Acaromyces ingoldii]PWN90151.1 hypothetical protein FA10DRAFT_106573 [Acaromyces ingoldii]
MSDLNGENTKATSPTAGNVASNPSALSGSAAAASAGASAGAAGSSGAAPSGNNVPKAIIKSVDMDEDMQQKVVDYAMSALSQFTVEKDIAAHVKRTMDMAFGATWHVVVGKHYGSYVTHESKHFIYFYLGQIAFLIWRA